MSSIKLLLWSKIFSETNDSDKTVMLMTEGTPVPADLAEAQAALRVPQLTVGTPVYAVAAGQTITLTSNPSDGDSLTVTNGVTTEVYEFRTIVNNATDIEIGIDAATTAGNAETAFESVSTLISATASTADLVLVALVPGESGNSITTSATGDISGEGAFTGGVDCTTAIKGDHYQDDTYLYTAIVDMDVTATTGWAASAMTMLEDIV